VPTLAGRLVLQFTISGAGGVIQAALQSSTLNNPAVEKCAEDALRRWSFPAPPGNRLVIVTVPFELKASR